MKDLDPDFMRIVGEHAPDQRSKDTMVIWNLVHAGMNEVFRREEIDPATDEGVMQRSIIIQTMGRLGMGIEELRDAEERHVAISLQRRIEGS